MGLKVTAILSGQAHILEVLVTSKSLKMSCLAPRAPRGPGALADPPRPGSHPGSPCHLTRHGSLDLERSPPELEPSQVDDLLGRLVTGDW